MSAGITGILDAAEWHAVAVTDHEPGEHYATHEAVLEIGDLQLRCYLLEDGRRVIDKKDFESIFGFRP